MSDTVAGSFNVLFTLLLGLLALWVCKSEKIDAQLKALTALGCCLIALLADWALFGVLYVLAFGLNRGNFNKQAFWFCIVSVFMVFGTAFMGNIQLFQLGVLLALPLLFLYNGKRGGYAWGKWIFYIFYPLHLLVLGLIKFAL